MQVVLGFFFLTLCFERVILSRLGAVRGVVCGVSRVLSYDYVKRRFMLRKPLDMRKAYGRLFAYGKQKAPWGVWSWLFA